MTPLTSTLIIDDSSSDIFITTQFLKRLKLCDDIISKSNGHEAIEYFRNERQHSNSERFKHQWVILDINMPLMNGFEFIDAYAKEFSGDPFFSDTIIVISSSSKHEKDVQKAEQDPYIVDFLLKPLDLNTITEFVKKHFIIST